MSMPCIWRTVTTQARAARPRVAASGAAVRYATFMLRIITATREIRNPVVACCRALKLRVARAYSRGEDNGGFHESRAGVVVLRDVDPHRWLRRRCYRYRWRPSSGQVGVRRPASGEDQ